MQKIWKDESTRRSKTKWLRMDEPCEANYRFHVDSKKRYVELHVVAGSYDTACNFIKLFVLKDLRQLAVLDRVEDGTYSLEHDPAYDYVDISGEKISGLGVQNHGVVLASHVDHKDW